MSAGKVTDRSDDSVVFETHVRPNSRVAGVGGAHDGALVVRVAVPPADGKANAAVVAALAESFRVPRSAVTIVTGGTGRRKLVRVVGGSRERLHELLER